MIQPLRSAHRVTFKALVFALPLLLAAAVASRKPVPTPHLARPIPTKGQAVGEFRFLFNDKHTSLSLVHLAGEPGDRFALHSELRDTSVPETLLYWTASPANDAVPTNASLVGSVVIDRPFSLSESYTASGVLVLYDAPHSRILAQLSRGKR